MKQTSKTKKSLSFLLMITLIITLLPAAALAGTSGDYEYIDLGGDGFCKITGYTGSGGNVVIPDTIDGLTVTEIDSGAFTGAELTSVTIPNTVTTIWADAFTGSGLSAFTLPTPQEGYISTWDSVPSETVYHGGDSVTALNEKYIRGVCKPIFEYVFFIDESLNLILITNYNGGNGDIVIPGTIDGHTVFGIGGRSFYGKGLYTSTITLPNSVMYIDEQAFDSNTIESEGLMSFKLPGTYKGYTNGWIAEDTGERYSSGDTVTDLYSMYFAEILYCETPDGTATILQHEFASGSISVPAQLGSLTVSDIYEFAYADNGITELTIPNTVQRIGDRAFMYNELTSVTIPSSVKYIGYGAFAWNEGLISFKLPDSPKGYTSYWNEYSEGGAEPESIESDSIGPATTRPPVTVNEVNGGYTVTDSDCAYEWVRDVPNKYTVTFLNDDDTVIATQSVDYGSPIPYPEAPGKEGFSFSGWDSDIETMPAEDLTITATYTPQYALTFLDCDGTVISTGLVDFGAPIEYPADPTREGYTFDGWDSDIKTMPAKDVTITATYVSNEAPRGNITGTLLGADGKPMAGQAVTLHSKVVKTVTDSNGRFTFPDVPLTDHTLIIESAEGAEIGSYDLSFKESASTSYQVDNTDVDVAITSNTVMIDILVQISEEGSVTIEKITFAENPSTGDNNIALFNWIMWVLLGISLASFVVIRHRQTRKQ